MFGHKTEEIESTEDQADQAARIAAQDIANKIQAEKNKEIFASAFEAGQKRAAERHAAKRAALAKIGIR